MIPVISSLSPLDTLSSAYTAYALDPTENSEQQKAAIVAIDSIIKTLHVAARAITSVESYFGEGGIEDIYLDSHLYQTADLLRVGPLTLSYVLRANWNAHLADRTSLDSISLLVRQAGAALVQATWFLASARLYFDGKDVQDIPIERDLNDLESALRPQSTAPLHVL
jgi:hypothetical protein